jgi:hypothetical protein
MKNYRYLGEEAEILGERLDHARAVYKSVRRNTWAKKYWRQVIEQLLFQWRQLPILHDGDAQTTIIPRWTIDYNFYELGRPHENYGITDKFYDKLFKHDAELESSWHHHREARLARAQY